MIDRKSIVLPLVSDSTTVIENVQTSWLEAGEGPPVLLFHGGCVGGSALHTWRETMDGLSKTNRVIALDLLWSGYTDKPPVPVSLPLQAAHISAFISVLDLRDLKLVGQSIGAYHAARAACDQRERVTHLAMISSNTVALALDVPFEVEPAGPKPADEIERQRVLLRTLYHRQELVTEDLVRDRAEIASLPGVAEARASFSAYAERLLARDPTTYEPFALGPRLAELDLPTLLIWGLEDRFAPVSIGRHVAERYPHITYLEVPDGGHAVFREQAETVNSLLRRFFAGELTFAVISSRSAKAIG